MWSVRQWCLSLLVIGFIVGTTWASMEEALLRVSVREEPLQRGSSCLHSLSQVELVNLDATEPIVIRSIQATPEETIFNVRDKNSFDEHEVIPPQFQILRLQTGGLLLGPNQVALVPITFLPRYPHIRTPHDSQHGPHARKTKWKHKSGADRYTKPRPTLQRDDSIIDKHHDAPVLSGSELYDWEYLDETVYSQNDAAEKTQHVPPPRTNVGYGAFFRHGEYKVKTTLVVETSRGTLNYPVTASSVRKNDYNVPDTITFFDENPRDCFHLHISNPYSEQPLEVREMMVSRADVVSVEHDMAYAEAFAKESGRERGQVMNGWNSGGPFVLSAGSQEVYVATICATPRLTRVPGTNSAEYEKEIEKFNDFNLGYLQMRTDKDTLFIILERERLGPTTTTRDGNANLAKSDDFLNNVNKMIQEFGHDASEKATTVEPENISVNIHNDTGEILFNNVSPDATSNTNAKSVIRAIPARAEFLIVTSVQNSAVMRIGLHNSHSTPVRIMVAKSVVLVSDAHTQTALKMNLAFGSDVDHDTYCHHENCTLTGKSSHFSEMPPIPPGGTAKDVLVLSCFVGPDVSSFHFGPSRRAVRFNGTVVVRASSNVTLSYDDWTKHARLDPESHLRLEIPYTVYVTDGQVDFVEEEVSASHAAVSLAEANVSPDFVSLAALFFPLHRNQSSASRIMEHRIRVFSPMLLSLSRPRTMIRGSDEWGLCRRFRPTSVVGPKVNDGQPSPGTQMFDLGTVTIAYDPEAVPFDFGYRDRVTTKRCYLDVSTEPVRTGVNSLPLLVYSGLLEASTFEKMVNASSAQGYPRDFASTVVAGIDNLLSWFKSSFVGSSLASTLHKLYTGRQQSLSHLCSAGENSRESLLLCRYLLDLANSTSSKAETLHPILIQHGAVGHGEIHTTSLYLTNHNPVPVTVSINVGEVEGMSISLGQDTTRTKGDGNSALDYLRSASSEKVRTGKWAGHSLNGLSQFLASSDFSLSWFSEFGLRDAVSLSAFAVDQEPLLRTAYGQSAKVDFHKTRVVHGYASEYRQADSAQEMFRDGEELPLRTPPGPLLVSAEQGLVHPLHVENSKENMERNRQEIAIPPGSAARFQVHVRGPPKDSLTKDVTPLVASGLVLSTDFGQVMPILSTFEVLVGQLRVTHVAVPSPIPHCALDKRLESKGNNVEVIEVPPCLFQGQKDLSILTRDDKTLSSLVIPPQSALSSSINQTDSPAFDGGSQNVSLFLNSTFSREVRLKKVESCNPWFKVVLRSQHGNETSDGDGAIAFTPGLGVEIGTLHSAISCLPHRSPGSGQSSLKSDALPEFPSFYHCVMNWLESRAALQPRGCGGETQTRNLRWNDETEEEVLLRAKSALKNAASYLDVFYGGWKKQRFHVPKPQSTQSGELDVGSRSGAIKSGVRRNDGMLNMKQIDTFAEVTDTWRAVSELGMHKISSSLRATIDYSYPGNDNMAQGESCENGGSGDCTSDSTETGTRSLTVSMDGLALQTALTTPRLFDCTRSKQRTRRPKTIGDEVLSVLDFPPTLVANVVALTVPLRNPTAVPVRVRLASAPTSTETMESSKQNEGLDSNSAGTLVRENYLLEHESVFIQNSASSRNPNNAQRWWDGGGAFFLADENGNIIQSHHNVTITAGAGAHVSLVNPSLHSTSAFVVGCGGRCGDRENSQQATTAGVNIGRTREGMAIELSPIGSAAASGKMLLGRPSLNEPVHGVDILEPSLSAGGAAPVSSGPAAFAVPYSSLDEIVLPPFGEAEIGPIFFRPPGRRQVLGCDFSTDKTNNYGGSSPESCRTKYFESMVFLENSLTGLERVIVRGRGLWERVVFLDPGPERPEDDIYGDLENRHGRDTLVFPGSSTSSGDRPGAGPVIKRVVVHNAGDVQVEFSDMYFSDAAIGQSLDYRKDMTTGDVYDPRMLTGGGHSPGHCENRNFRLLGCWEDDPSTQRTGKKGRRNLRRGFRLLPGHNRTLYIEHRPDCTFRQEFVTLNLEYRRAASFDVDGIGNYSVSRSGGIRHAQANHWKNAFRKRKVELFVGFDMSKEEMAACVPIRSRSQPTGAQKSRNIFSFAWFRSEQAGRELEAGSRVGVPPDVILDGAEDMLPSSVGLVRFAAVLFSVFTLGSAVIHRVSARKSSSVSFSSALRGISVQESNSEGTSSLWSAAFRCLARTDPSSTELQTLGREQVRQVVLNRYKSVGVLAPQCMNSIGGFQRERHGVASGSAKNNGKEGNISGSDKIRTLSDSIFQDYATTAASPHPSTSNDLPCGLGWRAAVSRGIVGASSVSSAEHARIPMKVRKLLQSRSMPLKRNEAKQTNGVDPRGTTPADQGTIEDERTPTENTSNVSLDSVVSSEASLTKRDDAPTVSVRDSDSDNDRAGSDTGAPFSRVKRQGTQREQKSASRPPTDGGRTSTARMGPARAESSSTMVETLPRKVAVAKEKKENGSVDRGNDFVAVAGTDWKSASANQGTKPRKASSTNEKVQQAQQKPKLRRERHRKNESIDSRGSDGGESKGSQKRPAKKSDGTLKNGREVSAVSNKNRTKVSKKAAKEVADTFERNAADDKSLSVSRMTKPSSSPKGYQSPSPSYSSLEEKNLSPDSVSLGSSSGIRPPPGLAPPPGFDAAGSARTTPTISRKKLRLPPAPFIDKEPEQAAVDTLSSLLPRLDEPSFSLVPTELSPPVSGSLGSQQLDNRKSAAGDLSMPSLSPSISFAKESVPPLVENPPVAKQSPADGKPLLGLGSGFNVMDFLDSILDDENAGESEGGVVEENTGDDVQGRGVTNPLIRPIPSSYLPVERKSRAAAYGIEVEETNDEGGEGMVHSILSLAPEEGSQSGDVDNIVNSIPLLTPAAILGVSEAQGTTEDDTTGPQGFNRSSFHASLLDE